VGKKASRHSRNLQLCTTGPEKRRAEKSTPIKIRINSIDLAIRLLLMMRVGHLPNQFSAYKALSWDEGSSLREFVWASFKPRGALDHDYVKLKKSFNARNLERIAGIRIKWTNNFADHLRILDDDDTQVAVFHHASFLEIVSNR
jgi:hypothetical protein